MLNALIGWLVATTAKIHLPPYTKPWDGHTTEQKYTAIRDALKNPELADHGAVRNLLIECREVLNERTN
jgi:hypothetical protein